MQTYNDAITGALAGNGNGPLTSTTIDKLRKVQAEKLESRWEATLEGLRRRAPFKDLPVIEQNRAFLRLASLNRSAPGRKPRQPLRRDTPMTGCSPGWNKIGELGPSGFDLGSADVPQVVPANDYNPNDDITGNTTVAVTFPQRGQIGIGAAMGGWCDIVWEPTQQFFELKGNRSSAFLAKGFFVPNLANLAPAALTVTCSVLLPSFGIALVAGDPKVGGELATLVFICGQATLDVVACNVINAIYGAPNPSKSASDVQQLFIESGTGDEPNDGSINTFGGSWGTVISDVDPSGIQAVNNLSATISEPLASSDYILATISVEVSAWSLPAIQSAAMVDWTGQNTGIPLLTAPGYLYPSGNTASAQPIQVADLLVCGI